MRAYQRRIIHIKSTGSNLFDEAYFLLTAEGEELLVSEDDMVKEANRIIEEESRMKVGGGFLLRYKRQLISLGVGMVIGACISIAVFVIAHL